MPPQLRDFPLISGEPLARSSDRQTEALAWKITNPGQPTAGRL